jgi:two-component system, sensor histidine kinase
VLTHKANIASLKEKVLTCLIILIVLHAGSRLSLLARHDLGVSDYYLPTALSVIFIHWVGPRYVIPLVFINAVVTSPLWGTPVDKWPMWFVFALPETFFPLASWYIFSKVLKGKFWMPNIHHTILFIALGAFLPAIIEAFMLQSLLTVFAGQPKEVFLQYAGSNMLSEFSTTFFITVPALYFITPLLVERGIISTEDDVPKRKVSRHVLLELGGIYAGLLGLAFLVDFVSYWYIYGFFALFVAIRYGFGAAIITNLYILILTYILPKIFITFGKNEIDGLRDTLNIFLGANFLFVFAAVTGRVITDLRNIETKLLEQNRELQLTNQELDRFVYSVSHDLTAPLKSIRGLVNISKMSHTLEEQNLYLDKIRTSVIKLEQFISEVLDYSRNKRLETTQESIDLKELCTEILGSLTSSLQKDHDIQTQFDYPIITQDKTRIKMIINNLLANAIRFQKTYPEHRPMIRISSRKVYDGIHIEVEDNGQGIRPEIQSRIFNMFFRGNERSEGSGLGLYIAKEAASKIGATIFFESTHGTGSKFVVVVKDLSEN